jgi:hypothetical protein
MGGASVFHGGGAIAPMGGASVFHGPWAVPAFSRWAVPSRQQKPGKGESSRAVPAFSWSVFIPPAVPAFSWSARPGCPMGGASVFPMGRWAVRWAVPASSRSVFLERFPGARGLAARWADGRCQRFPIRPHGRCQRFPAGGPGGRCQRFPRMGGASVFLEREAWLPVVCAPPIAPSQVDSKQHFRPLADKLACPFLAKSFLAAPT